jgi:hypothetical protein
MMRVLEKINDTFIDIVLSLVYFIGIGCTVFLSFLTHAHLPSDRNSYWIPPEHKKAAHTSPY